MKEGKKKEIKMKKLRKEKIPIWFSLHWEKEIRRGRIRVRERQTKWLSWVKKEEEEEEEEDKQKGWVKKKHKWQMSLMDYL